jgi:TPP-dependent pyruvate/acetoin dehydrogenase alpha subunit
LALNCAGDFLGRARSFNISAAEIKGDDPEQLFDLFGGLIRTVREKGSPHIQVIHTYRFCPHSKGDDHRSKEEVERHRAMDPFRKIGKRLEAGNRLRIERCALERIDKAVSAVTKI